jgi:hypothetical protein
MPARKLAGATPVVCLMDCRVAHGRNRLLH